MADLRGVTPLPDGHGPVLAPTYVEGEMGVRHQSPHSVTLLTLDHVTCSVHPADTRLLAPGTRLGPAADAGLSGCAGPWVCSKALIAITILTMHRANA